MIIAGALGVSVVYVILTLVAFLESLVAFLAASAAFLAATLFVCWFIILAVRKALT